MKLALPNPPRKVGLRDVPGAVGRMLGVTLAGVLLSLSTTSGALSVWREGQARRGSAARSVVVEGTIAGLERRSAPVASVLYTVGGRQYSASSVELPADSAKALRIGSPVRLSVDPTRPEDPLAPEIAAGYLRRAQWSTNLTGLGAGLVWLGTFLAIWLTARRERRPLREGLLIWLTPSEPLDGQSSVRGHYYRQDVRYEVRARVRPREAPIRNGEKVLAAVAPPQRRAVVVDERLAKRLGWLVE